ncbi:MAG: hypothetical protein A2030_03125 [Chloroflexi bacterium RBG_19FT_COMBO_50_10]|nr:MAG: hypothetical protein A2030_03125 [Chloroflexi bacterium RBG_19FT_COMBO_50_10]
MIPVKILLFSADVSLARLVSRCLIKSGYRVAQASHGIGALDLIHSEKPALIILDLILPGVSSLAIIRAMREEEINGRIPVILMGANMGEEDVLSGMEVGADLCLLEMFHPQVFIARVRSLLRRTEPSRVY